MIEPDFMLLSQSTSDRYGRAVHEYKRAEQELREAWLALVREQYASEQGPPDAEEDCSDLG